MITAPADTLTSQMWDHIQPILRAQYQHPFVLALGEGTLPRDNFEFYIRQDALYLDQFAKAFAFATTKTGDHDEMAHFGETIVRTMAVEKSLHAEYGEKFGLTPAEMAATTMAPTNFAYTRHILAVAAIGTIAEVLAVVLPCAWIYSDVGKHFASLGQPVPGHPYADWLELYSSPEFEEVGRWLRERLDAWAPEMGPAERQRCIQAFTTSARYEYMFWGMAWRKETWPV
jgi:thiaminase (transcriptional activator TenA)